MTIVVFNNHFKIASQILHVFPRLSISGQGFSWGGWGGVFQDHTGAKVALAGASYKMAMVTTIVTTRHSQMTACCTLSGATVYLTGLD